MGINFCVGFGSLVIETGFSPLMPAESGPAEKAAKKKATTGIAAFRVPKCLRRLPGRETNSLHSNMFPAYFRVTAKKFGNPKQLS
ncbi:hypothetical protein C7W93_08400 [Glaciimonas sp. PCH181]|nr:hypothetical protein C7W93_08400 [Glaciimonas sp. PCH181]